MKNIITREDGYVMANITEEIKNSNNYAAIQYLEDGLSYLNYAKLGSSTGTCNTEVEYETGMTYILSALEVLLTENDTKSKE